MASLFISYRRGDCPDTVKLLYERLKVRLPRWEIFYDHESIPLGEPFPERLRTKVTGATAVLVMIGPKWLTILQERKGAAIDHVHEEVRLALASVANVFPILAGDAVMPTDAELADFADLKPILQRNGRRLRPDPDFDNDLEPIVTHLKQLDSAETTGTILDDKYTLMDEIGHGGMGVVFVAQQKQPVRRTVAIKLIKPGMDSRDVLARFDAERQALAVMDHPNVAKVLDAGLTAGGRPFFVMEYVKGVPITDYCDGKKLTPQERLHLFIPVCNAVQHAHQKGILHRDIKPSNVLVEMVDGKPVPKVIDFGLAKALGQKLTDKTLHTAIDTRVGTLEYSSPEQAAGRSFDVDTRSDIYSLGILLYELLTGAPPFTHEELLRIGEEEMRRMIREVEPTKPSRKLSSSGELPAIAARCNMTPAKLPGVVKGDLDWIVMKCLEKEQGRRYETANQLGQELERFLKDEPVQAGPPSASYRAKKFLRRNKGPVLAAALVFLALIGGIIGTSIGMVQAEKARAGEAKQRKSAEANETKAKLAEEKERQARAKAQNRLAQIRKANDLIESVFQHVNVGDYGDSMAQYVHWLKIREPLAKRVVRLAASMDEEAIGDAEAVAELQHVSGTILFGLGEHDNGIEILTKAHATREKLHGVYHVDTFSSMNALALAYSPERKFRRFAYGGSLSIDVPADSHLNETNAKQAGPFLEMALERTKSKFGPHHPDTLRCEYNLAWEYRYGENGQQRAKGLLLIQHTLEKRKALLGRAHPDTLDSIELLALEQPEKATWFFEHAVEEMKANLGPDHSGTRDTIEKLLTVYSLAGNYSKTLPLYEFTLERMKANHGPDHRDTLTSMNKLANAYHRAGQITKAVPLYEEALAKSTAKLGPADAATLESMNSLAEAYHAAGQFNKALPLFEEMLARRRANLGFRYPELLTSMAKMAIAYCAAKQADKGIPLLNEYLAVIRMQENAPNYSNKLAIIGGEMLKYEQYTVAEPILRECLAIRVKAEPDAWYTFNTKAQLGASLLGQKKFKDAEPLLKEGYEGMKEREKTIQSEAKVHLTTALERLVHLYDATGNAAEADRYRKELAGRKTAAKEVK